MPSVLGVLERRDRVALARAEELRAELERLQAAVTEATATLDATDTWLATAQPNAGCAGSSWKAAPACSAHCAPSKPTGQRADADSRTDECHLADHPAPARWPVERT